MNLWLYEPDPTDGERGSEPSGEGRVRCPHCGGQAPGGEHRDRMASCPLCCRAFARCPRCGLPVRMNDYWRIPAPLPPLPPERAGNPMQFVVEDDPGGGERATFREAGHVVLLRQRDRGLVWLHCPQE
ncbi:MAG: hypothetical protein D6776_05630 [Planctomycetota bacterium]|nr:MAG: hypothetical protein D6776_05630 [Planctomycetota bacterium]